MEDLLAAIISYGWQQWLAFVFNILYVVLAARENRWCWFFGLLGVTLLLFIYMDAKLFSDALLQVFYIGMSIYGWISWGGTDVQTKPIIRVGLGDHLKYIFIGAIGTLILGFMFSHLQAAIPYVDAFTSSFAVVATFMVARKILDNWLYWIVIDALCVVIYWSRDLSLISFLFGIYTILAIVGYLRWRKNYLKSIPI